MVARRTVFALVLGCVLGGAPAARGRSPGTLQLASSVVGRSAVRSDKKGTLPRRKRPRRAGRLVQLRDGPGLVVRDPRRAWGTALAVSQLEAVFAAYARELPQAPPMIVHDLSRRHGGRLPPHRSHRGGRDVDIRLVLRAPHRRYVAATPRMLHLRRTWVLLRLLYETCEVQEVLLDRRLQRALYRHARGLGVPVAELRSIFEYPGHRHRKPRPMVIHWPGHADHMHVRFRPAAAPRALATITRPCGCLGAAAPRRLLRRRLAISPTVVLDRLGL